MLELRYDALANMLALFLINGLVSRQLRKNRDAAPLGALVERNQELPQNMRIDRKKCLGVRILRVLRGGDMDIRKGGDSVGDNHGVRIGHHTLQCVEESIVDRQLWFEVVQFCDADSGSLAHVRVLVPKTFLERIAEVVYYLFCAQAAHCADCEGAN